MTNLRAGLVKTAPGGCVPAFNGRVRARAGLVSAALLALGGCGREAEVAPARPVQVITVRAGTEEQSIQQTGEIRARYENAVGFQIDGKIIARPVDVGSVVRRGQLLAQLDPAPEQSRLRAAAASVAAARAEVQRAQREEQRKQSVLDKGFTTRSEYDLAVRNLETARAQLESAQAQAALARQALGYTQLRADHDGVVTQVGASAGQVVAAGQMVVFLVRPGEREAVFEASENIFRLVPRNTAVTVSLVSDPTVRALGHARYVAPQANPLTRTFTVRVSLPNAPEEMRLGATVRGEVKLPALEGVPLPGPALFASDGQPAVWLFDRKSGTAQLRRVQVLRSESGGVLISRGLRPGDMVITAGVNTLRPNQKVRLAQASSR